MTLTESDRIGDRVCVLCGVPYTQDGCPYLLRRDVDPPDACLLWLYMTQDAGPSVNGSKDRNGNADEPV
jgi:hypothetical protein